MTLGSVEIKLRLETRAKKDGDVWVSWCPALDIYTQADTKDLSHEAIKEAVLGWVESCLERKVLAMALEEVGFSLVKSGQPSSPDTNVIEINPQPHVSSEFLDEVEISVPAYTVSAYIPAGMGQPNAPN